MEQTMIGSNFFSSISTNFDSPKWINSKETINPEYDDDNCSQYPMITVALNYTQIKKDPPKVVIVHLFVNKYQ